ncbi:MAG: hypothetical protein CL471_02365, partial [Acidobacteria bacterium]|nr:hypothetical protein [Acidobacteriota bacterium]
MARNAQVNKVVVEDRICVKCNNDRPMQLDELSDCRSIPRNARPGTKNQHLATFQHFCWCPGTSGAIIVEVLAILKFFNAEGFSASFLEMLHYSQYVLIGIARIGEHRLNIGGMDTVLSSQIVITVRSPAVFSLHR